MPQRIGSWWNNEEEVDLVATSEEALLLGECKWTSRPVGTNILDNLKRKAHLLMVSEKRTQSTSPQVHYALFARAGFTPALHDVARAEGVLLVGPDDLMAAQPVP
jgi:hypothetical protein